MFTKSPTRYLFAVLVTILLFAPLAAFAQGAKGHEHHGMMGQGDPESSEGSMPEHCQAMKAHHEQMMQQHAEESARLEAAMETMRNATGDAKIEAMAEVLEALVASRPHHAEMGESMPCCMGGMEGMGHPMKDGEMMKDCPMKKDCPMADDCPMKNDCPMMQEPREAEEGDQP